MKKSENKLGLILEDSGSKLAQGNNLKKATEIQIHLCFSQGEGQHEYLGSENVSCILQGNGWLLMVFTRSDPIAWSLKTPTQTLK